MASCEYLPTSLLSLRFGLSDGDVRNFELPSALSRLRELRRLDTLDWILLGGFEHLPASTTSLAACLASELPPELASLTQLRS